jgi:metal-sulfur cluster biosynthetic enzyme
METQLDKSEIIRKVILELKNIYDPEIPVNIYDLGLVYEVNISDDYVVKIVMTLTTPNCPVAEKWLPA